MKLREGSGVGHRRSLLLWHCGSSCTGCLCFFFFGGTSGLSFRDLHRCESWGNVGEGHSIPRCPRQTVAGGGAPWRASECVDEVGLRGPLDTRVLWLEHRDDVRGDARRLRTRRVDRWDEGLQLAIIMRREHDERRMYCCLLLTLPRSSPRGRQHLRWSDRSVHNRADGRRCDTWLVLPLRRLLKLCGKEMPVVVTSTRPRSGFSPWAIFSWFVLLLASKNTCKFEDTGIT